MPESKFCYSMAWTVTENCGGIYGNKRSRIEVEREG